MNELKPTIVTLTGPSGSGKSTVERFLQSAFDYSRAISTTTRKPRPGEVDGHHYYFTDHATFDRREGEWVENVTFSGERYGLAASELARHDEKHEPIVVVCEPIGARAIRDWCLAQRRLHVGVFLDVSPQTLLDRFIDRLGERLDALLCSKEDKAEEMALAYEKDHKRFRNMVREEFAWVRAAADYCDLIIQCEDKSPYAIASKIAHQAMQSRVSYLGNALKEKKGPMFFPFASVTL